jgi:D-arabinono-1,4-lactone oxidase
MIPTTFTSILRVLTPTDSHQFPQHTAEWAIPYSNTRPCLQQLRDLFNAEHSISAGCRVHFPIEVRFSAPDDIWLSPSNGQRTTWIGIIQYKYAYFFFVSILSL